MRCCSLRNPLSPLRRAAGYLPNSLVATLSSSTSPRADKINLEAQVVEVLRKQVIEPASGKNVVSVGSFQVKCCIYNWDERLSNGAFDAQHVYVSSDLNVKVLLDLFINNHPDEKKVRVKLAAFVLTRTHHGCPY